MHHRKLKLGLASAGAIAMSLGMVTQSAFADYAPVQKDVVGVGSDTVQYASDFIADGDFLADPGYNGAGNKYKIINFDATPDANARLAYGPQGTGSSCAPGTGSTAGTGTQTTNHADSPCVLNPTIVLRQGTVPVQRPNGSGAGASAILTDTHHYISYTRSSSKQGSTLGAAFDSIEIGTDKLAILAGTTTNAVPLSVADLTAIYSCTDTTWTSVGGSSSATIVPLLPQVGSGTRKTFLADISVTNPGSCVQSVEENDPTAIAASSSPANAIEPMSGGRLNMFQGKLGDGTTNGVGGYFHDPSCSLNAIAASTPASCAASADTLNPAVKYVTGTPPDSSGALYNDDRGLYIYFRASDLSSGTKWQPGSTLNFVQTLFYNPCPTTNPAQFTADGCTSDPIAGEVGPGGAPYYATAAGQSLISAAGIAPAYVPTVGGP